MGARDKIVQRETCSRAGLEAGTVASREEFVSVVAASGFEAREPPPQPPKVRAATSAQDPASRRPVKCVDVMTVRTPADLSQAIAPSRFG
jgi:hypothetical protein